MPNGNGLATKQLATGEIDLDAGNNPDEWNVYLLGTSQRTKFSAKTSILTGDKVAATISMFMAVGFRWHHSWF